MTCILVIINIQCARKINQQCQPANDTNIWLRDKAEKKEKKKTGNIYFRLHVLTCFRMNECAIVWKSGDKMLSSPRETTSFI